MLSRGLDEDQGSAGLWLGDESWAREPCVLVANCITHRLQCNMREEDAGYWMATQWGCDCPLCPARAFAPPLAVLAPAGGEAAQGGAEQPSAEHLGKTYQLSVEDEREHGGIVHAYLPLFDDEPFARAHAAPLLQAGACFIHEALDNQGGRVYVHCEKGCSRSVSVVAQYLMEFRGLSVLQAAELLKARRCRSSPNGGFVDALVRNEQRLHSSVAGGRDATIPGMGAGAGDGGAAATAATPAEEVEEGSGSPFEGASSNDVLAVFRRPWLSDFRAGRVKPRPVDRIL